MENVFDITKNLAVKNIEFILDVDKNVAKVFYENMSAGKTLAQTLRLLGYHSVSQIEYHKWEMLRNWRKRHFPDNVKVKI